MRIVVHHPTDTRVHTAASLYRTNHGREAYMRRGVHLAHDGGWVVCAEGCTSLMMVGEVYAQKSARLSHRENGDHSAQTGTHTGRTVTTLRSMLLTLRENGDHSAQHAPST